MVLKLIQNGHNLLICDNEKKQSEKFICYEFQDCEEVIYGVYGIVEYEDSQFLVVVTQVDIPGYIGESAVYEINNVCVYTLGNKRQPSVIKHIESFFKLPGMLFSEYSLYERNSSCAIPHRDPFENEFLFNRYPLSVYLKTHRSFGIRCIQGFFGCFRGVCLVSRRSSSRAGIRYFSRGCDVKGNCSNFVETEQFIDGVSSYLQVRGSIPLFWSHAISWKYNPCIILGATFSGPTTSNSGFSKAHNKIRKMYKESIIYLNLIKETGYEGVLWKVFKKELKFCASFHYNFHKNAGRKPCPVNIKETGYSSVNTKQRAIIRTNCIDCLDRTNSMQYLIGKAVLGEQISTWNACDEKDTEYKNEIMEAFKLLFYENGNYLSIQYSGTPALLASHILGKNSGSKIWDGYFSVKRYFINRLAHGHLQNSYDIICGVKRKGPLHSIQSKCLATTWGFAICIVLPRLASFKSVQELVLLLFAVLFLFAMLLQSIMNVPL